MVGAAHPQVRVDQQEAERGLAEDGLRGGEVGLDAAQDAYVDDDADGGLLPVLGAGRHDVHLGEAAPPAPAFAVPVRVTGGVRYGGPGGVRCAEGDHAGPLPAVEDFGHLALAALAQLGVDEGVDGIGAHGVFGGDAEQLLRTQAPLVDEAVGTDGEGRDLDVVVDGAGRVALPHRVTEWRAVRRPLGLLGLLGLRGLLGPRWYLAHANRPLQLTASGTGHRRRLPAVSSTTAPHDTVFTITARSRWFSVRTVTTLPVF